MLLQGYSTGNALYNSKSTIPGSAGNIGTTHGGVGSVSTSYPSTSTPLDTTGHAYQAHNSGLFRYIVTQLQ